MHLYTPLYIYEFSPAPYTTFIAYDFRDDVYVWHGHLVSSVPLSLFTEVDMEEAEVQIAIGVMPSPPIPAHIGCDEHSAKLIKVYRRKD